MSHSEHIDKNFTEICSERTIFSEQQGFFGEMFEIVRNCCPEKWLKNKFEALSSDADKLRLLFDEPNVSDMLLGTLENVSAVYRKKDSAFSRQRRLNGIKLHEQKDFENALIYLTHAVLRAPAKGDSFNLFTFITNQKSNKTKQHTYTQHHSDEQRNGTEIIVIIIILFI